MQYKAPIKDIMFNIEHLSSWHEITSLDLHSDVDLDDANAVLEGLGRYCSENIANLSSIGDEIGSRFDGEKVIMPDAYKTAYSDFIEMGWQSLPHSKEHGGMGFPRVVGAAATEIINASDMSFGLCPLLTDGAIDALTLVGSEQQKQTYLGPLISGRWSGTMNLTEPQAGSDLGRVQCKAEAQDDQSYAISGTKIFITYGDHELSDNIIHLVLARTSNAPAGPKGLSLFIVPKFMVKDDGSLGERNSVNCISLEHKLGIKASPTAVLEYNKAVGYLVGEENNGLAYMFTMMMSARFSVGVQGVAISDRAYQHTLEFAKERKQSAPVDRSSKDAVAIVQHPDVRRMLLRMRAIVEGGRALSMATASWLNFTQCDDPKLVSTNASIAEFLVPLVKSYCTERSLEVTSLAIQVHGGMGFIEETGIAKFYRDARILPIYEGTTAIQANDLVSRKVLRDKGDTARKFVDLIRKTETELLASSPKAIIVAKQLTAARLAFQASLEWMLDAAPQDINSVFAGSVPFLSLAGNLAIGWQFGRSVLVAESQIAQHNDVAFMSEKIATACFYANHILIECEINRQQIMAGAPSMYDDGFQHLKL